MGEGWDDAYNLSGRLGWYFVRLRTLFVGFAFGFASCFIVFLLLRGIFYLHSNITLNSSVLMNSATGP